MTVLWDASSDDHGIQAYRVYRDGQLVGSRMPTGQPRQGFSDSPPAGRVTYIVRAVDTADQETSSAPLEVDVPPRNAQPGIPPGLRATTFVGPTSSRVTLYWGPSADDDSALTYEVRRSSNPVMAVRLPGVAPLIFVDDAPVENQTILYEVTAYDSCRQASVAATILVHVPRAKPPPVASTSVSFNLLLSKAGNGGFPNGPSRNPAISSDARISRYVAYESDASNLVRGDKNGLTDIFVIRRDTSVASFIRNGSPWVAGRTFLASVGRNGEPANGRSFRPALDGDAKQQARCLAFISKASNLVPDDTNGVADVFVRDLRRERTTRVSIDSKGRQANGPSREVTIAGDCSRVAYATEAPNLGAAATASGRARGSIDGERQIYVHYLEGRLKGKTLLASASSGGKAGNGNSFDPHFARKGHAVAFASEASNLVARDANGASDVFLRTLDRLRANRLQDRPTFKTRLISATKSGTSGNGASRHPAVDSHARYIAYETRASDIVPGEERGKSQIIRAHIRAKLTQELVSKNSNGSVGNGDSYRPVISAIGFFVFFDSRATNFQPYGHQPDENASPDVFKWYQLRGNVALESRDHKNINVEAGSQNPAIGLHGNYIPYESVDPRIDENVRSDRRVERIPALIPPDFDRAGAVFATPADGALHQVYMRYVGPCARTVTLPDGLKRCLLR